MSVFDNILLHLRDVIADEVIDGASVQDATENVMLDVEYSPVLPDSVYENHIRLYGPPVPCRVQKDGSRYCVWMPDSPQKFRWADEDSLREMRARYLLVKGWLYRQLESGSLPYSIQQRVLSLYFPDGVVVLK